MAGLNIVVSTWLALDISKFSWAALSATVISRSRTGTQTLPLEASALLEENSKSFCSICFRATGLRSHESTQPPPLPPRAACTLFGRTSQRT